MKSGIEYQSKMKIVSLFQSTYNRLPTDAELSKWYTVMNDNGFNIDVVRQGLGIGNTTYQQTCDSSSIWNGTSCVSQTTTQSICPTGYSWSGSTCTNSSPISSITVTYPQQSSVLSAGANGAGLISFIKWTSTGSSNDTVSIALLSNNTVLKYIASGVPNTGSYAWQYDPSIQNGTYQIEVYDSQVKGGGANGMSGTFQIINSPAGSTYTTYPTPTPTTQSRSDAITQLYVTLDHRQPDAQGLSYYLNSNMTLDQIKQNMMSSREYQAVQTVTNLYQTLENRAPDDQGLRYYVGLIITNGWTVNQITTNMMNSAEYRSKHSVQTTTTPIQAQTASTTLR